MKNGSRNILTAYILGYKVLYICLTKNTTA